MTSRRAFAKARRPERGRMNNTESAYAIVLEARKRAGEILDYRYECVSLVLGPDCRWTPDFLVTTQDDEVQLHEVKANRGGKWFAEDDARVKIKVARQQYPFRVFVCYPADKHKLHFHIEEIAA